MNKTKCLNVTAGFSQIIFADWYCSKKEKEKEKSQHLSVCSLLSFQVSEPVGCKSMPIMRVETEKRGLILSFQIDTRITQSCEPNLSISFLSKMF